jgi:hypothetical protein
MRTIAWITAVVITAVLSAGCGSSPAPTPYQQFVASLAKVGLRPTHGQKWEINWAKHVCSGLATTAENDPDETDLLYAMSVTAAEKGGDSETQAAVVARSVINDFCPQWKMLLKQ